jgi:phosphoribosylformylglycinamidine cyclo-ligase
LNFLSSHKFTNDYAIQNIQPDIIQFITERFHGLNEEQINIEMLELRVCKMQCVSSNFYLPLFKIPDMSKYDKRGVSAEKKDVHTAIKNMDKGLFPNAFCKILPDFVANDPDYVNIMHADTAGTKTSLAYLYWKETGDLSVWEGIVQDAIVMNLDDMACAGAVDNIILSSTIGRNKNLIPGDVIKSIIEGNQKFIDRMKQFGVNMTLAGGETADVGDIVRSIDVGITAFARYQKKDVITIDPKVGDVIIGLESCGQSSYEKDYNSGIGSNGLTFARHELLHKEYAKKYPESFDPHIDKEYVYTGNLKLTDPSLVKGKNIGQLVLSPTRTYLPVLKAIIQELGNEIHGIVHNTGGGQTKILHFIDHLHIVKNNPLPIPPIFQHIQQQSNAEYSELFKVFNMGQRLEFYVPEKYASQIIDISTSFNIHAQQTGYVEKSNQKGLSISHQGNIYSY